MNVLIGDSRALGIKRSQFSGRLREVEDIWGRGGGKYNTCTKMVERNLIYHHPPLTNEKTHFYILAGICNLTTLLREGNYEEVIFESENVEKTKNEILALNSSILNQGALPVFCTIVTMNLKAWNELRLRQRKTNTLQFTDNYENMQKELESAIMVLNEFIVEINLRNRVATPLIHTSVYRRKHGKTYALYKNLSDGCHPNNETYGKMVLSLN